MLPMLALLVAGAFALVVFGLGRIPSDQQVALLIATAAAAVLSAVLWVPLRARSEPVARRLVRRERGAPDEALRIFGTRLALALPLDELLLQLAETLRPGRFRLETAEVWIASDSLLEREPPLRSARRRLQRGPDPDGELRVLVRAGVCGAAWASVWLPVLVDGRADAELRVAPIVNADELLGLVVVQRHLVAQPFDEEDERVLGELARHAGLAFRNLRLDSALQASLDELRVQAAELRASRSRVVAAADAERRAHRARHPRRRATAAHRPRREPPRGTRARPAGSRRVASAPEAARRRCQGHPRGRSCARARHLPAAAARQRAGTGAACGGCPRGGRRAGRDPGRWGVIPPTWRPACTSAASRPCRTPRSTPAETACASLRVSAGAGLVRFEVTDDGVGFDPASPSHHGAGLQGMADRLGAVGGALTVASCPGRGTRISGSVPSG